MDMSLMDKMALLLNRADFLLAYEGVPTDRSIRREIVQVLDEYNNARERKARELG